MQLLNWLAGGGVGGRRRGRGREIHWVLFFYFPLFPSKQAKKCVAKTLKWQQQNRTTTVVFMLSLPEKTEGELQSWGRGAGQQTWVNNSISIIVRWISPPYWFTDHWSNHSSKVSKQSKANSCNSLNIYSWRGEGDMLYSSSSTYQWPYVNDNDTSNNQGQILSPLKPIGFLHLISTKAVHKAREKWDLLHNDENEIAQHNSLQRKNSVRDCN